MTFPSNTANADVDSKNVVTKHSARFGTAEAVRIYDAAAKPIEACVNALLDTFQMAFDTEKESAAQPGGEQRRNTVLDIGCGPGSYTLNHLLPRLPPWCEKLVGVDNSEQMLEFARENNADPRIEYHTLDLMKDEDVVRVLLDQGPFQRVYSFFTLHWMADQVQALKNIETLMAPGGECLLIFSDTLVLFHIFAAMMRSDRWAKYSELLKSFIPPTSIMKNARELRSHLAKVVAATNLTPLACEVIRTKLPMDLSREDAIEIFVLLNPVYPLLNDDEKPELRMFTHEFLKNLNERTAGDLYNEQNILVIHAYKPEN
ncbi:trans-aconitate 2-methyltransferase-like [Haemaphysalis longicornis]